MKGKVLFNEEIAPSFFHLGIYCPEVTKTAQPGQFVMLKINENLDPLLRRPFSFHRLKRNEFEILYEKIGKGTSIMTHLRRGDEINLLGPLGKGFVIKREIKKALLVGGGIGCAPLLALAERLKGKTEVFIYLGAKTASSLLRLKEFNALGEVKIATEDGSKGFHGKITDLIEQELKISDHSSCLYTCGPYLMLKKLSELAQKRGFVCQLSLEAYMGCGIGACLGCTVRVKTAEGFCYRRVCYDGPVFISSEVVF